MRHIEQVHERSSIEYSIEEIADSLTSVACITRVAANLPEDTLKEVLVSFNSGGLSPLVQAITDGDPDVVEEIVIAGLTIKIPNEDFLNKDSPRSGENPFLLTAKLGNVPVAEVLYDYYADDLHVS